MKRFVSLSAAAVVAALVFSSVAAAAPEAPAAPARVSGEKIDSGLGDLPHYRQWADPTGKNQLKAATAREAAPVQTLALQASLPK
jgi:hypothetical protein